MSGTKLGALVREARPKQWVKNVLVFAAPGAAGALDDGSLLVRTLVVFGAFCLVSSGTYYWNDIHDVAADRQHPTKQLRPVASGAIGLGAARIVGTLLILNPGANSCVKDGPISWKPAVAGYPALLVDA